jgi:Family of unknown function (DUF5706)
VTKTEISETYEKVLLGKLQRVIDFLKFAEAKNAALLTLSSALTIAIGNLLLNNSVPLAITRGLWIALPLAMAAGILAILSFLPRLCLPTFLGGSRAGPHPKNLLYFGDAVALSPKEYKAMMEDHYVSSGKLTPQYVDDLLTQIHINSSITHRKMRFFQIGAMLAGAAIAAAWLAIVFNAVRSVMV